MALAYYDPGLDRMDNITHHLKPGIMLAVGVLLIFVLYVAQALLVPIALAVLLTFVLTAPVTWLERWIGRVPAVLVAVTLVFTILGLGAWGLARQMNHLAGDLPGYRANILAKIADVRGAGKGGSVEKLQRTLEDLKPASSRQKRPEAPAPGPSSSLRQSTRDSRRSPGSVRSSVRWARPGSWWRW